MEIYQLPDILVICMKRFGSSGYYRKVSRVIISLYAHWLMSFKIDEFVDFPIEGLDMEERCDERRVAKTLVAQGKDLEKYGIDGNLEPLVYDLCKWYDDMGFNIADILSRRRRQPLWRPGRRALHGDMQEHARWQVVQV